MTQEKQDNQKRRGLGQGLSALFDNLDKAPRPFTPDAPLPEGIKFLKTNDIQTGAYQPRKHFDPAALDELATSIKSQGILHPLIVRQNDDGAMQLIAGERRLRAAGIAGLNQVPCRVLPITKNQALEISLLENVQRADLSAIEEALGYQRLVDEVGYTQETLAQKIGKSRAHLTNTLRLLKLPAAVQKWIDDGALTAGHGRALIGSPHAEALAEKAIQENWSVRQTERAAGAYKHEESNAGESEAASPMKDQIAQIKLDQTRVLKEEEALGQQLSNLTGLKVKVSLQRKGGTLQITFKDPKELDLLLQKLTPRFAAPAETSTTGDSVDPNASLSDVLNASGT